jgi:putative restriction endonuclease
VTLARAVRLPSRRMAAGAVNQWERASRAWPILTATAANKVTITYGELADRLRVHHRVISHILSKIQDYCLDERLPPLTILVVGKSNRHPGTGFIAWDTDNLEEGFHRVYEYPWQDRTNPFGFAADGSTPEELAERLIALPDEAEDIYRRVRDRGNVQVIFRWALLRAYDGRCAFCALSLREALQAAHIIPWRAASFSQRMDPSNGLLLCATHHALFDAGILSVGLDRRVQCHPGRPGHAWNDADHQIASALNGRDVRTPRNPRLSPSTDALAYLASHPRDRE